MDFPEHANGYRQKAVVQDDIDGPQNCVHVANSDAMLDFVSLSQNEDVERAANRLALKDVDEQGQQSVSEAHREEGPIDDFPSPRRQAGKSNVERSD